MTEYRCHWWSPGQKPTLTAGIELEAETQRHGAAIALRHFRYSGCDIATPHAHIDITDEDGGKHTLMVEEILDWLKEPGQADFIHREDLSELLH